MENENIQELKFQVGEAWKGVYSSSTAYGLANVVQDPTGLSIYRSLKSGNVDHPVSDRTWWFCIIDMSSIKAESDRIAALNQAISQDEALRVAAEELRQQHEAERVAAETQRNEAEQQRINAEQERVGAESARATAEQQRITAEEGRVSAESARVTAEQARVLAETLRVNAEDQRAANEQNRVAAEQQRIERAESDHQRVESDLADIAVYTDSLGAFDLSKHNAVDGVLATYADLSAALTALNSLDSKYKYGGMSFKFVLTSDNKYVQARCMAQNFTTDVTQWQGVGEEPTAGSENLVKSGGVIKSVVKNQGLYSVQGFYYRATTGAITSLSGCYSTSFIPIGNKIELYTYLGGNTYPLYGIAFFDTKHNFVGGYTGISAGYQKVVLTKTESEIPATAEYFTAMLPNGDNLDKAYIFRDNELLQLNINKYLEGKSYMESSAASQFVSGLDNMPLLTGLISNTQIREDIEKYIVIKVNGGDTIEIGTGINGSKIVILADFNVPTKYPYDFIFATGETTSRNISSGYSATLPSNAKYLLLRCNDATRNFLPQTFKINGYELCSDITKKIIPLTTQVEGLEETLNIETETETKTSYYNNTCEYIVGAIIENGGGINTSYTNYRSYYFYAPEDGSISIDVGSATWFRMNTGVGTPESLTVKHYGNYGDSGKPLPTTQNPWLVSKGDVIVFCTYYNVTDFVLTYSYDLVSYVITGATVKMPPKGLLVWNGTYFEFFSKRTDKQYVSFLIKHYKNDNDTVYQDVWSCREAKLYDYIDKNMVFNKDLMNAGGESEFTMLVTGKSDHTGGYHGDERLDGDSKCYVKFFADGREITAADMEDEFSIECDEFSYIEYTTLHETSATIGEYVAGHPIIAYHLKKVIFKESKNDVENYIKFTTQQSLSRFYSAIACVSKNAATQAVMDGNIDEYNGSTLVASYGTLVQLEGTRHYFRCENPASKNMVMFNTDNNIKINLYATMLQGISDADMTISQIWDRDGGDNDSKWYRNNGSTVTIQSGTIVANHQIIEFL